MDIYALYQYGSCAWLTAQGVALSVYPRELLPLLSTSTNTTPNPAHASDLTLNFLRVMGGFLIAIAIITLIVPLKPPPSQLPSPNDETSVLQTTTSNKPFELGSVALPLTSMLHGAISAYCYMRYMKTNTYTWGALLAASGSLALLGLMASLFGDESRASEGGRWPFETGQKKKERREKWVKEKEELKRAL